MKQFMMNVGLVLFIFLMVDVFFDDYQISNEMLQREKIEFEQKIDQGEIVGHEVVLIDTKDNQVSLVLKDVSGMCQNVIEYIVLFFSNFVSMILIGVLY